MAFGAHFILLLVASTSLAAFLPPSLTRKVPINSLKGGRIINGQQAAEDQFPYQAALYLSTATSVGLCGGAIISPDWVLTAAHCLTELSSDDLVVSSAGTNFLTQDVEERVISLVESYVIHENYNSVTLENDIAAVKLLGPLPLNGENIGAISFTDIDVSSGTNVVVSGWGVTEEEDLSENLRYAELVTITNEECGEQYGSSLSSGIICAQSDPNEAFTTTCNGDSGSPLVVADETGNFTLIGLVSFGPDVGCLHRFPAGFTNVPYFREWIRNATGV